MRTKNRYYLMMAVFFGLTVYGTKLLSQTINFLELPQSTFCNESITLGNVLVAAEDEILSNTYNEGYVGKQAFASLSHRRIKMTGTLENYYIYSSWGYLPEVDWNLGIRPHPDFDWLWDIQDSDGLINGELTPDRSYLTKSKYRFYPELPIMDLIPFCTYIPLLDPCLFSGNISERPYSSLENKEIGIYGVLCQDLGHDGNIEFHPFDALWWGGEFTGYWGNYPNRESYNYYSYGFGVFQDDSERFNGDWSKPPRNIQLKFPFSIEIPDIDFQTNQVRIFQLYANEAGNLYVGNTDYRTETIKIKNPDLGGFITLVFIIPPEVMEASINSFARCDGKLTGYLEVSVSLKHDGFFFGGLTAGYIPYRDPKSINLNYLNCIIPEDAQEENPASDELQLEVYIDGVLKETFHHSLSTDIDNQKWILNKSYPYYLVFETKLFELDGLDKRLLGSVSIPAQDEEPYCGEYFHDYHQESPNQWIADYHYYFDFQANDCISAQLPNANDIDIKVLAVWDNEPYHIDKFLWGQNYFDFDYLGRVIVNNEPWDQYQAVIPMIEFLEEYEDQDFGMILSYLDKDQNYELNHQNTQLGSISFLGRSSHQIGEPLFETQHQLLQISDAPQVIMRVNESAPAFQLKGKKITVDHALLDPTMRTISGLRNWSIPLDLWVRADAVHNNLLPRYFKVDINLPRRKQSLNGLIKRPELKTPSVSFEKNASIDLITNIGRLKKSARLISDLKAVDHDLSEVKNPWTWRIGEVEGDENKPLTLQPAQTATQSISVAIGDKEKVIVAERTDQDGTKAVGGFMLPGIKLFCTVEEVKESDGVIPSELKLLPNPFVLKTFGGKIKAKSDANSSQPTVEEVYLATYRQLRLQAVPFYAPYRGGKVHPEEDFLFSTYLNEILYNPSNPDFRTLAGDQNAPFEFTWKVTITDAYEPQISKRNTFQLNNVNPNRPAMRQEKLYSFATRNFERDELIIQLRSDQPVLVQVDLTVKDHWGQQFQTSFKTENFYISKPKEYLERTTGFRGDGSFINNVLQMLKLHPSKAGLQELIKTLHVDYQALNLDFASKKEVLHLSRLINELKQMLDDKQIGMLFN